MIQPTDAFPLDPEPWLDPLTRGDRHEVRWATVDRTGERFYDFAPREGFQQDRSRYETSDDAESGRG